jgi:hypothetical protein
MSESIKRMYEVINGETLYLASRRGIGVANDVIYGCRLTHCHVQIGYPGGASIFCSSFTHCILEVSRTCRESWDGCFFDACTFRGKYYDCRFGLHSRQCSGQGGLRRCDFTAATLNLCSYLNCTPDDLRLPPWPHVTIFYPQKHADDCADLLRDPILATIHESMTHTSPEVVAITYHLPSYIKQTRPWVIRSWELGKLLAKARSEPPPPEPVISLETIRELLQKKSCVFM